MTAYVVMKLVEELEIVDLK